MSDPRQHDAAALRRQFTAHQHFVLRALFDERECEAIARWFDYENGRMRNCFGDPDTHPLLSRVNAALAEIFGKPYRHVQTAIHESSDRMKRFHDVHIDFPEKLFAFNRDDTLQVWGLLRQRELRPDDELLVLYGGFEPDARKAFRREQASALAPHRIRGLAPGDVLVFHSWAPHSTGSIDHPYEREAFKVHYYSDRAMVDSVFLRANLRQALRVSLLAHNGTAPILFAADRLWGRAARRLLELVLALKRRLDRPRAAR